MDKNLGKEILENLINAGYTIEDVQKFMAGIRSLLKDPKIHAKLKANESKDCIK